jgi:hypothetical protein
MLECEQQCTLTLCLREVVLSLFNRFVDVTIFEDLLSPFVLRSVILRQVRLCHNNDIFGMQF